MSFRKFFPVIRTIYAKEIRQAESKIEAAKQAYNKGDKKSALLLLKEAVHIDGTCIAARGQIGKIASELKEEEKNQPGIKPK